MNYRVRITNHDSRLEECHEEPKTEGYHEHDRKGNRLDENPQDINEHHDVDPNTRQLLHKDDEVCPG